MPDRASGQDDLGARPGSYPVAVFARGQQLDLDPVRMDRHQLDDLATRVGDDLVVGVAAQSQVALQHLTPLERILKPVRPLGHQAIKPMVRDLVLAAIRAALINHQRQRCGSYRPKDEDQQEQNDWNSDGFGANQIVFNGFVNRLCDCSKAGNVNLGALVVAGEIIHDCGNHRGLLDVVFKIHKNIDGFAVCALQTWW